MKISVFAFLVVASLFASCKKEEVKPTQSTSPVVATPAVDIQVEYRINAVSGNFKVKYKAPENGQLVEKIETINRLQHTISFDWKSANKFKVEASNTTPSTKEVTVEIYINGNFYASGIANSPNAVALAETFVY